MVQPSFLARYFGLLEAYVTDAGEEPLAQAAALGRELVLMDVPLEEIAEFHEEALCRLAEKFPHRTLLETVRLTSVPLREMLMAYGLAYRERLEARKRTEKALQESEARYRAVVEGSIQGISVVSKDGKRLFANAALATMLGYDTPETFSGQDAIAHVAPHERARLRGYREALLRGKAAPTHYEYQGVRQDGTLIWLEQVVTLVAWEGELALLSTLLDITTRKQVEEERRRLEEQLRQSQKMEAIGTLAGGIAHDFNNILAAMIGYTELSLHDIPQDSLLWHNLQEVLTAGTRAKSLVQQILTFSRQGDQDRKPVQLHLIVGEMLTLLRASLPTTIEIRPRINRDADTVLADATQMHQVLMNLCANAEYVMRATGGILEVCLDAVEVDTTLVGHHPELKPGPYVRIIIRDTGDGMEPEIMARIFEPFFTTKEVGEGTGMGLAMVHGIVTGHHGVITVQSTPGKGTTFTIYFPRIDIVTDSATRSEVPAPRGKGCILFVDDEVVLARLGEATLARLGYEVVIRTSSVEALEAFRAMPHRFDLVITDQTMPNMTGEVLAQELRRIHPAIPIILCTGFSHIMNEEKAQAIGIDAFLMKPVVAHDLALAIQQVMRQRTGQNA